MKPFTLYLLHSSHTDVGYTDTQEKMKFHHVAFIREVLELIEHEPRFKWNCETVFKRSHTGRDAGVCPCGEKGKYRAFCQLFESD